MSPSPPLPSIFPIIKVFSKELVLRIRWPKYWSFSFSISPANEYSGPISFRMTGWISLLSKGVQSSPLDCKCGAASLDRPGGCGGHRGSGGERAGPLSSQNPLPFPVRTAWLLPNLPVTLFPCCGSQVCWAPGACKGQRCVCPRPTLRLPRPGGLPASSGKVQAACQADTCGPDLRVSARASASSGFLRPPPFPSACPGRQTVRSVLLGPPPSLSSLIT